VWNARFEQDRHPVERPAHVTCLALAIAFRRDVLRLWVDLQDAVELRAVLVERLDARQEHLDERLSRQAPVGHCRLELGNACLVELRKRPSIHCYPPPVAITVNRNVAQGCATDHPAPKPGRLARVSRKASW
jgi:hypothetical protein